MICEYHHTTATVGELDDDIARINAIDPQDLVRAAAEFVKTRKKVVAELEAIKAAQIRQTTTLPT